MIDIGQIGLAVAVPIPYGSRQGGCDRRGEVAAAAIAKKRGSRCTHSQQVLPTSAGEIRHE